MSNLKVADLEQGQKKTVIGFHDYQIGGKLMAMGMVPGSEIELIRTAVGGKTFYIKFNGYNMAVRRSEAEEIVLS